MAMVSQGSLKAALGLLEQRLLTVQRHEVVVVAAARKRAAATAGAEVAHAPDDPDNVVGVGIGEKMTQGIGMGTPCVRIYVKRKFDLADVPRRHRLPTEVDGVPTDVVVVGTIKARGLLPCSANRRRFQTRPVVGGISVGHPAITAGTLGVRVRDASGALYILSNNHVLANENNANAGDLALQPGRLDGGNPANAAHRIGTLTRFVPINFSGAANFVDCAIAKTTASRVRADICTVGAPAGTRTAQRNLVVQKHGRTTGFTIGRVVDVNASIWVEYDAGVALFRNQMTIVGGTTLFSSGGDSGSLILDMARRACGLLFAGSDEENVTFANHISRVFSALQVSL